MMCKYINNDNVWIVVNKGNFVSTLETFPLQYLNRAFNDNLTKKMSASYPIVILLSQNIN
jgi:hypothetical protein